MTGYHMSKASGPMGLLFYLKSAQFGKITSFSDKRNTRQLLYISGLSAQLILFVLHLTVAGTSGHVKRSPCRLLSWSSWRWSWVVESRKSPADTELHQYMCLKSKYNMSLPHGHFLARGMFWGCDIISAWTQLWSWGSAIDILLTNHRPKVNFCSTCGNISRHS